MSPMLIEVLEAIEKEFVKDPNKELFKKQSESYKTKLLSLMEMEKTKGAYIRAGVNRDRIRGKDYKIFCLTWKREGPRISLSAV